MPALAPITISGLADKTGANVESIRVHERLGFIAGLRRGPLGYQHCRGEDVEILTFVSQAHAPGSSVVAIIEPMPTEQTHTQLAEQWHRSERAKRRALPIVPCRTC